METDPVGKADCLWVVEFWENWLSSGVYFSLVFALKFITKQKVPHILHL